MTEIKRVYKVTKKYKWKAFRFPSDKIKIGETYRCEETLRGVRFTLLKKGPYKVISEASDTDGNPRYGMIKFLSDDWNIGDEYTIESDEKTVDIIREVKK